MTKKTLHAGRHLHLVEDAGWEYATRPDGVAVVAIVALTDADELVLVEQFRAPLGCKILELPAGLVGDDDGTEDELDAAKRELEEETGYVARDWRHLFTAAPSPGLTDERVSFWRARGLEKTGPGGGDGSEDITVKLVPRVALLERLEQEPEIDMKLLAAMAALRPSG